MKNSRLFKNWGTFCKGMDPESIQVSFAAHLQYSLSKDQYTATEHDLYSSLALTVRDRLIERWIRTQQLYYHENVKRVYYLSAEYLMGRVLATNLFNLGMHPETEEAMADLNIDLSRLCEEEPDMGLGNGGLGRLAACFLDSLATLEIPAHGYGIRYEFGIFDQEIREGRQVERPENWLRYQNPWEVARPEYTVPVRFYGRVEYARAPDGRLAAKWVDSSDVLGMPYDTPICGFANNTVNTLRLWSARASKDFDLRYFQEGDYLKAVEEKNFSENISKVLYPSEEGPAGRELRLKQQYFFVSCSIQDIIRRYLVKHRSFDQFPDKVAIHLNDTHPSLAVAELMRILLDDHAMGWDQAWDITVRSLAYTNHTLLSEALEKWPVSMLGRLLPRPLDIIYEINRRFLRDVSLRFPEEEDRVGRMSLIEESPEKRVRMAHLAIVGSRSVNGVAKLHTRLLTECELSDFAEMFPERFNNKTNGVTPRRWLLAANRELARLITGRIGDGWLTDLSELEKIVPLASDPEFLLQWRRVKHENKLRLARVAKEIAYVDLDPASIFDVQVKRIHEYKRQLLNILHVLSLWHRLRTEPGFSMHPRSFLFGGKAAPDYRMAKLCIRLICHAAEMINRDPETRDTLRIAFLPNYRVSLAEKIFPAADISEQISTAGYEASGTSNMKFALNGALTVGTLDGANIEIAEAVGEENMFIFGMSAEEIRDLRPRYRPRDFLRDPHLQKALELIAHGFFSPEEPHLFRGLVDDLLERDPYLVLADFDSYREVQAKADGLYADRDAWTRMAILNVARMGKFSSDRTIREYNREIWRARPLRVTKGGDCDKPFRKRDPR